MWREQKWSSCENTRGLDFETFALRGRFRAGSGWPFRPGRRRRRNGAWGESFDSPDKAVEALVSALKKDDVQALISIFGSDGKDILASGDKVADQSDRTRFIELFKERHGS